MITFPKTPPNIKRLFVEEIEHVGLSSSQDFKEYVLLGYDKSKKQYSYFFWDGTSKMYNLIKPINNKL